VYSATVVPALLVAVTRSIYRIPGHRPAMVKLSLFCTLLPTETEVIFSIFTTLLLHLVLLKEKEIYGIRKRSTFSIKINGGNVKAAHICKGSYGFD
jgi:hypothetical protein